MASSSFIPKGQEGLLLRSPLTFGFSPPSNFYLPKPIYTKEFDKTHLLGEKDRQVLLEPSQSLAFYTRNNPHPARVHHLKGLLNNPICCVEDQLEARYLLSAPSGQDFGCGYRPQGSTRYSANINKGNSAIGVVPVTTAWRDELEKKTHNAILRAMGDNPPLSRESTHTQMGMRKERNFDHLNDERLLDLLCRILQTDSIPSCMAWLKAASEGEKNIVLNMIKMAACGELNQVSTRPHTSDSQSRYVWAPDKSHKNTKKKPYWNGEEEAEFNFPYRNQDCDMGGLNDMEEEVSFKLPANDTIVKTARQLSRLASRNSSRRSTSGEINFPPTHTLSGGGGSDINTKLGHQLNATSQNKQATKRQRSASLHLPTLTNHTKGKASKRIRSLSEHSGAPGSRSGPTAPVKVSITKETIHGGGGGGGRGGGSARLRYTSHWGDS